MRCSNKPKTQHMPYTKPITRPPATTLTKTSLHPKQNRTTKKGIFHYTVHPSLPPDTFKRAAFSGLSNLEKDGDHLDTYTGIERGILSARWVLLLLGALAERNAGDQSRGF
ncbi:hypothetical protein JTE90_013587 [Oedothorax gibbosus]|uniref:Uncharacterized protein n=1 Tax=Oedothorax gibbosus TaxID=931172 RepID=A0AAV6VF46_9ARAC|nr:hypothetical protein JTE90_013587 [Oedothorax gibbosus]